MSKFTALAPFDMELECPPDEHHPFTYDCSIRVEASYYISPQASADDADEIRLDQIIRESDHAVIETDSLTEDQIDSIELEALERVKEALAIADARASDGQSDGDERIKLPDFTD